MPRTFRIRMAEFPQRRENQWYAIRLLNVTRGAGRSVRVEYEHTDREQFGRTDSFELELPFRPSGLGASLLAACQIDCQPGSEVEAHQLVHRVVRVRFDTANGQPLAFMKSEPPKQQHQTAQCNSEPPPEQKQP